MVVDLEAIATANVVDLEVCATATVDGEACAKEKRFTCVNMLVLPGSTGKGVRRVAETSRVSSPSVASKVRVLDMFWVSGGASIIVLNCHAESGQWLSKDSRKLPVVSRAADFGGKSMYVTGIWGKDRVSQLSPKLA